MTRIYNGLLGALASVCLVLFILFTAHASEQETVKISVANEGKAPVFTYVDTKGKPHTLNPKGHKLTALHLWATWCVPCVDELPMINDAQEIFGKKGLNVVALALDGKRMDKVQKFYKDHKITHLEAYLEPTQKSTKAAGFKGLPGTLFLDETGNIVARANGPLDWQEESVDKFLKARLK